MYRSINVVLLALMLTVIAMFLVWKIYPAKLDARGQQSISDYIAAGEARATVSLESLANGDPAHAQQTLADWEQIGVGDRYHPYKRHILLDLSKHYFEVGEYQQVVDAVTPAIEENDRDIVLFIEWSKSALNLPDLQEAATTEITLMAKRFPDHAGLQTIYYKDVLHKGNEAAGQQALLDLKGFTPTQGGWSVLWKLKPDPAEYEPVVWSKITRAGAAWSLTLPVPTAAETIRVGLPANARLDISNIEVSVADQTKAYDLSEVIEIQGLDATSNVLSASGSASQFFVIGAPEWLSELGPEPQEVTIVFDISNVGLTVSPT